MMAEKVTQNFQCRVTVSENIEIAKAISSFGFETPREFVNTFSEMLNSGELTSKLRDYRYRKVNNRVVANRNIKQSVC
jgi:hypothetical protein